MESLPVVKCSSETPPLRGRHTRKDRIPWGRAGSTGGGLPVAPTPPPTTATELQDEAREISPIVEASASIPQNSAENYEHVLPSIIKAISDKDYQQVINIAQETDYDTIDNRQPSRLLVIAPLVLSHLILDELPPARYALLRLPETLASLPLSQALLALVTSTINREHANIYEQAETLHVLVSQPDFFDKDLATMLQALLVAFLDSFRLRTFDLLSKKHILRCRYR